MVCNTLHTKSPHYVLYQASADITLNIQRETRTPHINVTCDQEGRWGDELLSGKNDFHSTRGKGSPTGANFFRN